MTAAAWFGQHLRELREGAGMSRPALASKAGLSARAITQWERGEREPSWSMVLLLCSALGVSCEAFTQTPTGTPGPHPRGRPRKTAATSQKQAGQKKTRTRKEGKQQ
jgi:transcriptional regulator with XRE-family HTH domain